MACAQDDRTCGARPTSIIFQFISTFGVWIIAERVGLSGVLTTVCYAIALARTAPELMAARMRIPSYVVWDAVVFALNILAFIFIGLRIRPILESLQAAGQARYFAVAGAVLLTVIVVRFVWHMSFNSAVRWRHPARSVFIHCVPCCSRASGAVWTFRGPACEASSLLLRQWRSQRRFRIAT